MSMTIKKAYEIVKDIYIVSHAPLSVFLRNKDIHVNQANEDVDEYTLSKHWLQAIFFPLYQLKRRDVIAEQELAAYKILLVHAQQDRGIDINIIYHETLDSYNDQCTIAFKRYIHSRQMDKVEAAEFTAKQLIGVVHDIIQWGSPTIAEIEKIDPQLAEWCAKTIGEREQELFQIQFREYDLNDKQILLKMFPIQHELWKKITSKVKEYNNSEAVFNKLNQRILFPLEKIRIKLETGHIKPD